MAKLPAPGNDAHTYAGHSGIDFLRGPKNLGKPILASGPGVVLRTPKNAKGGQWTTIRYDNGATIGYAHQDKKPPVKKGDRVYEGMVIGYVGQTGTNVTGPHVHVENINNPTEAGVWAVFDRTRVVGSKPAPKPAAKPSKPAPAKPSGRPTLRRGSRGAHVYALQQRLKSVYPLYAGHLDLDSIFGPDVQKAVEEFQRRSGLDDDGIVGTLTWKALGL